MTEVKIKDSILQKAATEGMDAFIGAIVQATYDAVGGDLTAETMAMLTSDQITLLAWSILHEEVMDGGYVQLIHNGYGAFIFHNPFAIAMREWGLNDVYTHVKRARRLYEKYHEVIERDYTDDEFMALFEQMPEFDDFDDEFVEMEELWTAQVAEYVDEHIEQFVTITDE